MLRKAAETAHLDCKSRRIAAKSGKLSSTTEDTTTPQIAKKSTVVSTVVSTERWPIYDDHPVVEHHVRVIAIVRLDAHALLRTEQTAGHVVYTE